MNSAYHNRKWLRRIIIGILAVVFAFTGSGVANAANLLDVSSWQSGINVTTTGADIVVAKATEGTNYVNPDCDRVVQQALSSGKGAGVYHFANTANSPTAEADYFVSQTRGYVGKGIVPILDWEPRAPGNVWWAQTWLNRVESLWGTKPIIYMNQSTENAYNWTPVVQQNYGLWIAAYTLGYQTIYGFNPPATQPRMYHWPFAVAWQYTSSGRVNGWNGNVDLSVVYGSLDTWRAYAGGGTAPAVVTPPTPAAPSISGTDEELADRVIRGEFGTIPQRQALLGNRFDAVQAIVNQRLNGGNNGAASFVGACAIVSRGDSLSGIAARFGTSWQNLYGYRSGNPTRIYPGERVCTKTGGAATTAYGHRVTRGESLWSIYGTGWSAAASRNGIRAPYIIYPGQVLR